MNTSKPKRKLKWWQAALIIPFVPVIIAVAAIALVFFVVSTICLHIAIWTWWCLRGRDILFVYSDSPIWRDYIEQRVLPCLGERAIVLNWSQLAEQAMKLPTESRARLADLLVESLDAAELGQIDRLWVAEAKRRRDEVRSGRVETIPGDEALQKVRDVFRR